MPDRATLTAGSTPSAGYVALRLRQQELVARFGRFALREDELQATLDEACRIAAEGLETNFAKVLEWLPAEGLFLARAGVGWRPGLIGHARIGADLASPSGYAFRTGEPVISNHLEDEDRFRTPRMLVEHGVRRAINVLIGEGETRFGVLEADCTERRDFDRHDTAFLQALANTLAAAVESHGRRAAARQGEAFLRSVLEASPDCVKVLDTDGTVLSVSANGASALGIGDPLAVVGSPWTALWPEAEAAKVGRAMAEARSGRTARFEAFRPTAQGAPRWWDVVVAPVLGTAGEPPTRLVSVSRDVTERVEAAAAKDLLVAEVHHRVKNSLQLVQSLLGLQARAADGEAAVQLAESAARVRTIAALHDRLYRANAGLEMAVVPYLEGLAADLRDSLAPAPDDRDIRLEADPATWAAADLTTLGLVLTELVTNALKYGKGNITVTFRQPPGGQAVLVVEDEGPGMPADFDPARSRGLGMRLVTGLLSGHGGSLQVDRDSAHTRFVAWLPRPPARPAAGR